MNPKKRPDAEARLASHLLVGFAAGAVVGKRSGLGVLLAAAILTVLAHKALDAPVAQVLAELGF